MTQLVCTSAEGMIGRVILNRPEKRNAISGDIISGGSPNVVTGSTRAFSVNGPPFGMRTPRP